MQRRDGSVSSGSATNHSLETAIERKAFLVRFGKLETDMQNASRRSGHRTIKGASAMRQMFRLSRSEHKISY